MVEHCRKRCPFGVMKVGVIVCCFLGPLVSSASAASILYGVARDGQLYRTDADTGISVLVGQLLGGSNFSEIEIDPNTGNAFVLYGPSRTQQFLQQIDLTTATFLGSAVTLAGEFSALEFVAGTLYGSGAVNGFYTINPSTGGASLIAGGVNAGGLAYDPTYSAQRPASDSPVRRM